MVSTRDILWGIAGLLIGSIVTHWLELGRERRKEFNELADKFFIKVDVNIEATSAQEVHISESDIKQIRRRMGCLKKWKFDRAMARFHEAASDTHRDTFGHSYYTDPVRVTVALKGIAKCLDRK